MGVECPYCKNNKSADLSINMTVNLEMTPDPDNLFIHSFDDVYDHVDESFVLKPLSFERELDPTVKCHKCGNISYPLVETSTLIIGNGPTHYNDRMWIQKLYRTREQRDAARIKLDLLDIVAE